MYPKGRSGLVKYRIGNISTGQVRTGQVRKGQVSTGQVSTGQVRAVQVRTVQVKEGQDRTGPVRNLPRPKTFFSKEKGRVLSINPRPSWTYIWG